MSHTPTYLAAHATISVTHPAVLVCPLAIGNHLEICGLQSKRLTAMPHTLTYLACLTPLHI